MRQSELEKYTQLISNIAGKEAIKNASVSSNIIRDYYRQSAFYYRNFHSKEGAMHLPVKFSEESSHKEKLRYQADTVHVIINESDFLNVLELGCGAGFNSNYLAGKNPNKKFTAIDLEPNNIKFAKRKSKQIDNVLFREMDFHDLSELDTKYDLIFAVETLCHSTDLIKLLNSLSNKLSDKGKIILFDGYIKPKALSLTNEFEKQAYNLLSWGFVLDGFQKMDDILNPKNLQGLDILKVEELSENVLSNASVFQQGSIRTLKYPFMLKTFLNTGIISLSVIKHLSAGLFMAYFLKSGYLGYYKLEFQKSK